MDKIDSTPADDILKNWLSGLSASDSLFLQSLNALEYEGVDTLLLKKWQQGQRADLPRLSTLLISAMGGDYHADTAKYILKEWAATIIYSPTRPTPGTWDVYSGTIPDNLEDLEDLLLKSAPERCHASLRFLRRAINKELDQLPAFASVLFPEEKPTSRWRQILNKVKSWWAG